MPSFDLILTHPGSAHKDELLACAVLLATQPVPIIRREPTETDLSDPAICVVDVGHRHDPALNNFDHHQLLKNAPPVCALSLVLKHLGLYEDAREFCEWLEPAEWFDCRGPFATAEWLGVERDVLAKLNSPIDLTLLRRFSLAARLAPGDVIWEMLRMIGQDLIDYVQGLRARLILLEKQAEFWTIGDAQVLFLPQTEPPLEDHGMGIDAFLERRGKIGEVAGLVYPDRRGSGFGLSRFRDDLRLDFNRIAQQPDVHFAHARGFVAKTSATETDRLKQLLREAWVPEKLST
ncbi:MAG: MYG1 family protein [Opitutus sp.]